MTTEVDVGAGDDPALAGPGMREAIVSLIETTRRHWEIACRRSAAGAIAKPPSRVQGEIREAAPCGERVE